MQLTYPLRKSHKMQPPATKQADGFDLDFDVLFLDSCAAPTPLYLPCLGTWFSSFNSCTVYTPFQVRGLPPSG